jgi:ABC-type phosphate transport system substrate-binding protein
MRRIQAFVLLAALCLCAMGALAQPPPTQPFVVIVHPDNPLAATNRKLLSDAFLKKVTRWGNGELIRPVDQAPETGVRRKFSEDVLNRSVAAVRSYWQQIIFSGRDVPPPELPGDAEVVRYVVGHSGAVGYVSGSANTEGTKILPVR